ncbi:MAG: hypothetical protein M1829_003337 [Trizodia sp. TS-e1964]|nr:MAG: hypothetical protein M1829_003337 [Trizodia sp. TS-e1964]
MGLSFEIIAKPELPTGKEAFIDISIKTIETTQAARRNRIRIKNRRKRYLDTHPDYFGSNLELAGRATVSSCPKHFQNPLLYDRLIRRFQSPAEREAEGRKKGYSGVLEADLARSEAKVAALADRNPSASSITYRRGEFGEILEEEKGEAPENKDEGARIWRDIMGQRFLRGEDEDFDFRTVDENDDWDDCGEERRDLEESWFDMEEPSWAVSGEEAGGEGTARLSLELKGSRRFSTSPQLSTGLRRQMYQWLNGHGAAFRDPLPGSTNYLNAYDNKGNLRRLRNAQKDAGSSKQSSLDPFGKNEDGEGTEAESLPRMEEMPLPPEQASDLRPFPLNTAFTSQPVLSEELRDEVWRRVVEKGQSVRTVSSQLGVEMRRVGAVVRLKTIEKQWVAKGKSLATPYANAILSMLPTTPFDPGSRTVKYHEPINDLPVHPATRPQIFLPTSESRVFTRSDAAKIFDSTLLPADERIPHPELIAMERDKLNALPAVEVQERAMERTRLLNEKREQEKARRAERAERKLTRILPERGGGSRWEWRFKEISVDQVGKDGRGVAGVGSRYGIPHEDRKKGQVKIPTRVL